MTSKQSKKKNDESALRPLRRRDAAVKSNGIEINPGLHRSQAGDEALVSKAELRSGGIRSQTSIGDITESMDSLPE